MFNKMVTWHNHRPIDSECSGVCKIFICIIDLKNGSGKDGASITKGGDIFEIVHWTKTGPLAFNLACLNILICKHSVKYFILQLLFF